MKILMVDDEVFILNLGVRILNKLGYTDIETANNGNVALEKLNKAETSFDLVLCDLSMPEMDGIEFMSHMRSTGFDGSMVFISGEDSRILETATTLAKAHKIDILGFLKKPIQLDLLEKLLSNYVPRSEKRPFTPEQSITLDELESSMNLRADGIDVAELVLHYQPKVCIKTGNIVGVETLARWQHEDRGLLGPGAFVPMAEESGLIDRLSYAIYKKAIAQTSDWLTDGIRMKTSINFSINTFSTEGFLGFIADTANEYGIEPAQVVLEVTETQVMENATKCVEILTRMRLQRFCLSIDDFVTGNSSMIQLKNIPFTELKIDRAFVHGAAENESTRAILEASLELAKKFNMETVAEGAETREDWDLVEKMGCDYVQGYYCARPMPNDEFLNFFNNWDGPHKTSL
jgi:EAL domain-containing protein (putative c-di-GMP-specific phosphodiesterase class I)/DNA-binding NarL/FixJ family response regulator